MIRSKALQRLFILSRKRWLVALLFVAGCVAYWVGAQSTRKQISTDGLFVSERDLAFGEVWEQKAFVWTLPVHNSSGTDVTISGFGASCTCVSIEPHSLVIPAGTSRQIKLTLDLTRRPRGQRPTRSRTFTARVVPRIVSSNTAQQAGWTLEGQIRTAFTGLPTLLAFDKPLVKGDAYEPLSTTLRADDSVSNVQARCEPPIASVTVRRAGTSGHEFMLEATPHPAVEAGLFKCDIVIQPLREAGEPLPSTLLPVQGIILSPIQVHPPSLFLGPKPVGITDAESSRTRLSHWFYQHR
jgi:hypothetical protein